MAGAYAPGDLVFCRPGDAFGALIARGTGGPYSHVQIIVAPTGAVVEARLPLVRRIAASHDPRGTTIVAPPYACAADRDAAVSRALAHVGRRYSVASLASDTAQWAVGWPLVFDAADEYNCAELAAECLGLGLDGRGISPNSLYRALRLLRAAPCLPWYTGSS